MRVRAFPRLSFWTLRDRRTQCLSRFGKFILMYGVVSTLPQSSEYTQSMFSLLGIPYPRAHSELVSLPVCPPHILFLLFSCYYNKNLHAGRCCCRTRTQTFCSMAYTFSMNYLRRDLSSREGKNLVKKGRDM